MMKNQSQTATLGQKIRQALFLLSMSFMMAYGSFLMEAHAQKLPVIKSGDPLPANAFIELAKLVNPSVVNISTETKIRRGPRDPMMDMLEQFYGRQLAPRNIRPQTALGTGFIIREDGLIVTNNHVVDGADVIKVQLNENSDKLYEAKLIGKDTRTDLALIKIKSDKSFPALTLGTSKDVEVGEWVAAFGNPFGQGHTMTKGIISAKGREVGDINRFPLLQTDTPINPGNSGGPLVNLKGQVIAVNSAIIGGAQNIGFAIPIDEAKTILNQLEKNGKVKVGFLGVGLAELSPQYAKQFDLEPGEGCVIASVEPGSPAAKAGLKTYDVVSEFNSKKIKGPMDLTDAVAAANIGAATKIKVNREGKKLTLDIIVGERTEKKIAKLEEPPMSSKKFQTQDAPYELGFNVTNISDSLRKEYDIPEDLDGPVVVEVARNSTAGQAGLEPGDVILDVNRKEVKTASDVLKNLKKGTNTLRVSRDNAIAILVL